MKEFLWKDRLQILASCILLIIIWEILAKLIDNPIYLPTVEVVLANILIIFKSEDFFINVLSSAYRTIVSFLLALISSIFLGIVSSGSSLFRNILKPVNALSTSIPTMVLVVLALIWFDKDNAPFIVGIFIVFPILYEGVLSSILGVDKNIIEMTNIYKVKKIDKLKYIYFPLIKFQVTNLLVSTFSLAFKVVIAGEVHGQPKYGIGTVIQYEKMNFNTEAIFAWIIIIAIISFALDILNKFITKKSFKWRV